MLQYGVAALEKDMPFPADCNAVWRFFNAQPEEPGLFFHPATLSFA